MNLNSSNSIENLETYNIEDCSSQNESENVQDEITEIDSPECSEKRIFKSIFSSVNKNKSIVRRNIFNYRPTLDIKLSQSRTPSTEKVNCQDGIKRKMLSPFDAKSFNSHDFHSSLNSERGKKLKECDRSLDCFLFEKGFGREVTNFKERNECTDESCYSSLITKVNKPPSPEILSDDQDCQDFEDEIISSQDSSNNYTCKKNEFFIQEDACDESSSPSKLFPRDYQDKSDIMRCKEDIVYSQDSQLSHESEIFNKSSTSKKIYEEDGEGFSNHSKEDISHDSSTLHISSCYNKINYDDEDMNKSMESSGSPSQEGKSETMVFHGMEIEDFSQENSHVFENDMNKSVDSSNSVALGTFQDKGDGPCFEENGIQNCSPGYVLQNKNSSAGETESINLKIGQQVKAPKKGSLLQRASLVISDLRKEANLFDHEIKVGLRGSKGLLVTQPLLVKNIYFEEKQYVLSCTSQDLIGMKKNQLDLGKNIYVILTKLPAEMKLDSIIVIHFPLIALVGLPSMSTVIFAQNRLQVISLNKDNGEAIIGSIGNVLLPDSMIKPKEHKIIRVINKKHSSNVLDALVTQVLGSNCLLELRLLHLFQRTDVYSNNELLAVDSQKQFCIVQGSDDILLQYLEVEVGNLYKFNGFKLKKCLKVKDEVKSAAEYYSSFTFSSNFIYILEPYLESWEVDFVTQIGINSIEYTPLNSVIEDKMIHKRFKLAVNEYKIFRRKVFIRDESLSVMIELVLDELCYELLIKFNTLSVPFILSGIYYSNGCLFYDKYSQLLNGRR